MVQSCGATLFSVKEFKPPKLWLRRGGKRLWRRGGQRAAEGRRVDVAQDVYFGGNSKGMKDLEFLDETVECYRSDFHP